MSQIAGYILTGGKNRRMDGKKKLFLTYQGETFLQRIQKSMDEFPVIYLSVDEKTSYQEAGLPMIEDLYAEIGPIGGIYSGLSTCPEEALFVAACDMPFLTKQSVRTILSVYEKEKKNVVAWDNRRVHPLLGIYTKDVLPVLSEMIEKGRYKMMDLLEQIEHIRADISSEPETVRNINSLQDYEKLKNR